MPDLFDNFFGRVSTTMNGGKSKPRYGGASQVNSGKYYSYHSSSTNNNSWLPIAKPKEEKPMDVMDAMEPKEPKPRMDSISSMMSSESANSKE
ncbi:hypothetical protein OXX59_002534 [Metschnikowia pulcherrima]